MNVDEIRQEFERAGFPEPVTFEWRAEEVIIRIDFASPENPERIAGTWGAVLRFDDERFFKVVELRDGISELIDRLRDRDLIPYSESNPA
jgi:hypothetical protein